MVDTGIPRLARSGTLPFDAHDPAFTKVVGDEPRLVRVVEADAHEGPVYAADEDALYFTTLPRPLPSGGSPHVAIERLALDGRRFPLDPARISVVRSPANAANGMTLDLEGRLLVCEQGTRETRARISRLDRWTGRTETVVDAWHGLPLNSPNDAVVRSDGTVWFTDPTYGHLQGFRPEPRTGDHVYRYDPAGGRLSVVADALDKPNGLAFSPDERILYVADSGANHEPGTHDVRRPHHVLAFDVLEGRRLSSPRLFAVTAHGFPDGLKVDREGRVYASSWTGVEVYEPSGDLLGQIRLPGTVNFTFGGPDGDLLFITTDTRIWAARLNTTGAVRTPVGTTP